MTVAKLIELLKPYPPDALIVIVDECEEEGSYDTIEVTSDDGDEVFVRIA